MLTYDNARPRLQAFCDGLQIKDDLERTQLSFRLEGNVGFNLSATVYLPSCLPPDLQEARSKDTWRTEKMAKRDACSQAFLALYRAGLVTDHLLPPKRDRKAEESPKDGESTAIEKRDSSYRVQKQYDPWPAVSELWRMVPTVYAHRVRIEGDSCNYPPMLILLPQTLPSICTPLYITSSDCLRVTLDDGHHADHIPLHLARDVSFFLLNTVLGRRLGVLQKEQLPFLLVPDMEPGYIRHWYHSSSATTPMIEAIANGILADQRYLLRRQHDPTPYFYQRTTDEANCCVDWPQNLPIDLASIVDTSSLQIQATRLSKRLEYLSLANAPTLPQAAHSHTLFVSECTILGLLPQYAHFMLLVPSITHMLEVALRSARACLGPLSSLRFDNLDLVSEAMTIPMAGDRNYQRLEFFGDNILKLYSSLQVFVDYPLHPESLLSIHRDRIVNNACLQRATRSLGLDQFLTRHRFSGPEWRAGVSKETQSTDMPSRKNLSSKVLADVIESLLAAASLTASNEGEADTSVVAALKLFIPEVSWRTIAENLNQVQVQEDNSGPGLDQLAKVESMIGYSFQHRSLLAESLTQSGVRSAVLTYNRLEFLGDAVLDDIVKRKLFNSSLCLDPEHITLRRHALVSRATLAFFALSTSYICRTFELQTDPASKKTVDRESSRRIYLPDHIRRIGSRQDALDHHRTVAAYHEVQDEILEDFTKAARFPWAKLLHLGAPKSYSDIVESILGAVFIDSKGSWDACRGILDRMGFMRLLERAASDVDFDTHHPEAVLQELRQDCELVTKQTKSGWRCKVVLDGKRIAHARKCRCKDEAVCRAADRAVQILKKTMKEQEEVEGLTASWLEKDDDDGQANNDITMT